MASAPGSAQQFSSRIFAVGPRPARDGFETALSRTRYAKHRTGMRRTHIVVMRAGLHEGNRRRAPLRAWRPARAAARGITIVADEDAGGGTGIGAAQVTCDCKRCACAERNVSSGETNHSEQEHAHRNRAGIERGVASRYEHCRKDG